MTTTMRTMLTDSDSNKSGFNGMQTVNRSLPTQPDATLADEITVIIPAYNEEEAIASQLAQVCDVLDKTEWRYELIVVNDGSTDGTAVEAARHPVQIINLPKNRGYGAAIKRGVREARSELILIIDADGTYPTEAIPALLQHAHDFDMVVGARIGEHVQVPWLRRPAKAFLRGVASLLLGARVPDINSGLRIIRRPIVSRFENILSSRFSFTSTLTLSMACNGLSIGYVPINYNKRIGKSKIRAVDALAFLLQTVRTIVLFSPLRVFIPLGLLSFALGTGALLHDLTRGDLSGTGLMGILAALIIWSLGLLADMIARINHD